jgi:hypothetical protein
MKLLLMAAFVLVVFTNALYADWDSVARVPVDSKIEITMGSGARTRGDLVSSIAETLVVRDKAGERTLNRGEIRQVGILDNARRVRKGILWTAIGAGGGAVVGGLSCPQCPNEGYKGYTYVAEGAVIGAIAGAVFGFVFHSSYRKVY